MNNKFAHEELKIFPNPFSISTSIAYDFSETEVFAINIFDISGKNVTSNAGILLNKDLGIIKIFKNSLECGIYIVKIESSNGCSINKFIVE